MNEENDQEPRTEEAEVVKEEVNCFSREEVKNLLRRTKKGKVVGPDELPGEVLKCMEEMGIKFLTRLFNRLLMGEQIPEEWRRSMLIPIYKNKWDTQCYRSYKGIKLISHTMKIWERIIEARLRDRAEISEQQYGFMPGSNFQFCTHGIVIYIFSIDQKSKIFFSAHKNSVTQLLKGSRSTPC